mmetsp:Transcript_11457/g.27012  ORF Transcript_11457/g.27012 Transcript_11457/m.27012 type:complete len:206 (-) Transcript_11457:67-684(-)
MLSTAVSARARETAPKTMTSMATSWAATRSSSTPQLSSPIPSTIPMRFGTPSLAHVSPRATRSTTIGVCSISREAPVPASPPARATAPTPTSPRGLSLSMKWSDSPTTSASSGEVAKSMWPAWAMAKALAGACHGPATRESTCPSGTASTSRKTTRGVCKPSWMPSRRSIPTSPLSTMCLATSISGTSTTDCRHQPCPTADPAIA